MKSSDRTILLGVIALALVAAFWFLILTPKRQEASDLETQVSTLQSEVAQVEAFASSGEQAKAGFRANYRQLVTLGKAIPVDADTPSLLTQLQTLSARTDVAFQSITLGGGSAVGAATPLTTPTATEASASLLPIGASVGAAGLPVMPYTLEFQGGFFEIADFFGAIDDMVDAKGLQVSVNGRLLTIDSFTLNPLEDSTTLSVSVQTTSYLSPADQGTTGGASPSGPLSTTGIPAAEPTTASPTDVAPAVVAQ